MTNNKGITLIALVITIIVLLILAGVSIAMLTGDNGILTQANKAKDDTAKAEIAEKVNMAIQSAYTKKITEGDGIASAALTGAEVATEYNSDNGPELASASGNTLSIKLKKDDSNATYTIELVQAESGKSFKAVTKAEVK